ncbi:MAG: GIY-YIG nuclease family protein [Parvibaculaceae bacterium]|nr:GIY-YIG nuclease family protein [Parvibaculaceae bacterium]
MAGIVYVLTNEAMPGLVKIGKTTQDDPLVRMDQLYTTGVPVPFECAVAMLVDDPGKVEKALHLAFGPHRVNPGREFFEINPEQAVVLIQQMGSKDVTPEVIAEANKNVDISDAERAASKKLKSRRPNLNFREMDIAVGTTLVSVETGKDVTVIDERHVSLDGEVMYLTRATRIVLELDYSIAPASHWTCSGKNLSDIYNETYPLQES